MQSLANIGKIKESQIHANVRYGDDKFMSPALAYLFLCADAIQDKTTFKWTFINCFDLFIISTGLEFTIQNFRVAGKLNNVPAGTTNTEIRIVDKKEKIIATSVLSGLLEQGDVQFAAVFNLVKFDKPGRYFFRTYFGGKKLADGNRYYFDVIKE